MDPIGCASPEATHFQYAQRRWWQEEEGQEERGGISTFLHQYLFQ